MGVVVGMDIPYKRTENPEIHLVVHDYEGDGNWDAEPYPLKDVILMQCTGLKDKNGKLIFEGDIVLMPVSASERATVIYIDACFQLQALESNKYIATLIINQENFRLHPEVYEVIGNIWEHPELLKEDV